MQIKTNSSFPLSLAKPTEILSITKIEARSEDQNIFDKQGLTLNTLIQFIKKDKDETHILICNGKTIKLDKKWARMIRVSICDTKEKSSACSFCLHKGSCHG